MQIKDLPASSALNADDVLAKDTNGVATEKITGANLAAAVKLLASLLGVSDVVNNLIGTDPTKALGAPQGKALNEHIGVVQNGLTTIEIDGNSTTHTGGAAQGDFVIVRNSTISGITDGLYTAAQAIPANTAIDSTYLSAVSGGGLNELNHHLVKLTNNYTPITLPFSAPSDGFIRSQIRVQTQGRAYVLITLSGNNYLIDGYNIGDGYINNTIPVPKGTNVNETVTKGNCKDITYYWTSFNN